MATDRVNPFKLAQDQFDRAAERLDLGEESRQFLREPMREYQFAIPVHTGDGTTKVALGVDARTWVFGGGEDHALAACFPTAGTVPQGWDVIGRVEAGAGVDVEGWPDWSTALADGGYEHFRR